MDALGVTVCDAEEEVDTVAEALGDADLVADVVTEALAEAVGEAELLGVCELDTEAELLALGDEVAEGELLALGDEVAEGVADADALADGVEDMGSMVVLPTHWVVPVGHSPSEL